MQKIFKYMLFKKKNNMFFNASRKNKQIALTFDDGPIKETNKILDVLKKHKIKATFFLVGTNIEKNIEIVKEIKKGKHEIGNHSYDHSNLWFKSKTNMISQIKKTDEILKKLNITTNLIRPPKGIFGFNLIKIANKINKKIILWDVIVYDWFFPGVKKVSTRVIRKTRPGSIILLHDNVFEKGNNKDLPKILDDIIPKLKKQGYKFKTVSELLNFK